MGQAAEDGIYVRVVYVINLDKLAHAGGSDEMWEDVRKGLQGMKAKGEPEGSVGESVWDARGSM